MYGKWVRSGNWEIFIFCCPDTAQDLLYSRARKFANLLDNGYKPNVEYRRI